MKRLLIYAFLILGFLSCSDTVQVDSECASNERLNPITSICEPVLRANDNGVNTNNQTTTNNNTTGNNGTTSTTASCTDCAVEILPGQIDFEYTPVLENKNANITLKSNVDNPITITSIEFLNTTADEFTLVGLTEGETIAGQGVVSGNIQFQPMDQTDDEVTLSITFDGIADPATIKITTKLTGADLCSENCPKMQVSPTQIGISYQPMAPPIQRTIILGSVGQANLEIREILLIQQGAAYSITHDALPLTKRPGDAANLDLTFDPAAGASTAEILIRSNDPFTPEVTIPVSATTKGGSADPCINVTPTTLNFGSHQRGQTIARNFAIANCGAGDLNVRDIQRGRFFGIPTTAAYQLTGWTNGMIMAGQTQIVNVEYSPGRSGTDIGSFNVLSDAVASPSVRVNLRGISELPPITDQDIHIEITWDSDQTDVDMHVLLLPGNQAAGRQSLWCPNDCYFSQAEPDWGVIGMWQDNAFLDRDDVDGHGPENVNIAEGIDGMKYRLVLHYYRDSQGDSDSTDSDVTVKLYLGGVLTQTWGPINLGFTGQTKDVFEISWPDKTITTLNDPVYVANSGCVP